MKKLSLPVVVLFVAAALPAGAKDLLSIHGAFDRVTGGTSAAAISNSPAATFDMNIGNNKARVTITASNLSFGTNYPLIVGGIPQAILPGKANRKAALIFQNFPKKNAQPLDFDPRGQVLTIATNAAGTSNVLTLSVGTLVDSTNLNYHESRDLTPLAGGTAEARFDQDKLGARTFRVILKGAAAGNYDVYVDGLYRGTLTNRSKKSVIVFTRNGGRNDRIMDFDPRNRVVDVFRTGTTPWPGLLQFSGRLRTPADGVTRSTSTVTESTLLSTGLDPDAAGTARYITTEQSVRQFRVSVTNLEAGAYSLYVDGTNRGSINVASNATSGQVVFSTSPDDSSQPLLAFDPAGKLIQVIQTLISTNIVNQITNQTTNTLTYLSGGTTPAAPAVACSATSTELPLLNPGAITGAQAGARYLVRDDCVQEFRVVITGAPVGAYDVYVGGALQGTIAVATSGAATSGSVVFSTSPADASQLPWVDPRGQLVEIRQGASTVPALLSRDFPLNP